MTTDDATLPDRVRAVAEPVAASFGVAIVDVRVQGQRGRRLVRIVADLLDVEPGSELDIDTIAVLSRQLGDRLDDEDLIAGAYTLEVTSPGVDRPLRAPRDFLRNVGREVRVRRVEGVDGPSELIGTVVAVADEDVTLEVDGATVRLPLEDVDHGRVVLPW